MIPKEVLYYIYLFIYFICYPPPPSPPPPPAPPPAPAPPPPSGRCRGGEGAVPGIYSIKVRVNIRIFIGIVSNCNNKCSTKLEPS
jgi:hypothetical protein